MKKFFSIIAFLIGSSLAASAQDGERLTVVELFTSQGCSSCPPADAVLKSLRDRPGMLTLSWPVDYWDRLGWEDTFAHPHNSMRQAAYNKRFGRGGVFTPQMVFDGRFQSVGSRNEQVRRSIELALHQDRTDIHPIISIQDNTLTVTLPQSDVDETIAPRAVWFLSDASVDIGEGENRGRTLHYTNVVRSSKMLPDWNGETITYTFDIAEGTSVGADSFALLLQEGYYHGPIVGAGTVSLNNNSGR